MLKCHVKMKEYCVETNSFQSCTLKTQSTAGFHFNTLSLNQRDRPHTISGLQAEMKKLHTLRSPWQMIKNHWCRKSVYVCTSVNAHLFCSHRLKHLLQQDPHLLDVVHQHAGLEEHR